MLDSFGRTCSFEKVSAEGSVFECLTQQSIDRLYTKEKDPYIEEHWKQYHDPYLLLLQFNSPIMNVNMKGVNDHYIK